MPRPSRNLTRISVYLTAESLDRLDDRAARLGRRRERILGDAGKVTRSDVIRLAVEDYLKGKP